MATETTNYGLTKPDANEFYDINVFNSNSDIIDTNLKKLSDEQATHADRILSNLTDPAQALSNIGAKSNDNLLINSRWDNIDNIIDQRGGYITTSDTVAYSDTGVSTEVGPAYGIYKANPISGTVASFVNVDGITFYCKLSECVRGYLGSGYRINCWTSPAASNIFTVGDGYISVESTTTTRRGITQYIEKFRSLAGETLTLSTIARVDNGAIQLAYSADSQSITKSTEDFTNADFDLISWTFTVPVDVNSTFGVGIFSKGENAKWSAVAAKLELGSVQTLARQDADGNWVLNDPPPDKHLELLKCCMSTADPTDTYANNKLTPAAINAVNKAGDTMTGALRIELPTTGGQINLQPYDNVAYLEIYVPDDYSNRRKITLISSTKYPNVSNCLLLENVVDGVHTGYTILHTGNKPSGSYTGNGDATERTIETGGIGGMALITSGDNTMALVTSQGVMWVNSQKVFNYDLHNVAVLTSGCNIVLTTDGALNINGRIYNYQVL